MTSAVARRELSDGAWVTYQSAWLAAPDADALMASLIAEEPWEQKPIVVFGREVMQPRLISWGGELPYKYSGQTLPPRALSAALDGVTRAVCEATGVPFNHVLLNRYRDGQDNMAFHCDNEPELGKCPVIAAISLGVERRFVLQRKRDRRKKKTLHLGHGSLLVMGGTIQHTWRHAVPRMVAVRDERINLTFRLLKGPPGWRGD